MLIYLIDKRIKKEYLKRKNLLKIIPQLRRLQDLKPDGNIKFYDKESNLLDLKHSINQQLDNDDIKRIYLKDNVSIYSNEDFTFIFSDNLAIRFDNFKKAKEFISLFHKIDEKYITL
jgi:hypothetical protein